MSGLVLPPGGGRKLVGPAQHVTFKITGERSTVGSVFEVVVPVGFDVGAHRHTRSEEFFYVLEGEVDMFAFEPEVRTAGGWQHWRSAEGDTVRRGTPGSLIHIPPGVPHGFANAGDTPARMLFQAAPPPDHERYFEELLELLADGEPPAGAVDELRRRWDIEQLTPLRPGVPLPAE
ncbi:cupin domain-containing protein [Kitasatospora viridis]|uniref:1,3,6,8-tetrahydroxynaphthalene monooxygenase n=1 Tax=Kitasatospora viridis TaxID=281105 RepID=A0A561UMR6_9ACTN|nr:cupin domain-containing protein [Kitasatospora viridis]TWG00668.1 1,3,6,8-tetrahydroxynaphthalene monooxygenase [Kitasatospora viridis]